VYYKKWLFPPFDDSMPRIPKDGYPGLFDEERFAELREELP